MFLRLFYFIWPYLTTVQTRFLLPVYLWGLILRRNSETAEKNMKNPRTRAHNSFLLAEIWIWWGPWLTMHWSSVTHISRCMTTSRPPAATQTTARVSTAQSCTPRYFMLDARPKFGGQMPNCRVCYVCVCKTCIKQRNWLSALHRPVKLM